MTDRKAFEAWYLSLHGSTRDDLHTVPDDDLPHIAKDDYYDLGARIMWQAWQARQPEIDQLRAEVERLRISNDSAWQQAQLATEARNGYGVQLSMALRGEKHSSEPDNDGRMQSVRDLVAEVERLKSDNLELLAAIDRQASARKEIEAAAVEKAIAWARSQPEIYDGSDLLDYIHQWPAKRRAEALKEPKE